MALKRAEKSACWLIKRKSMDTAFIIKDLSFIIIQKNPTILLIKAANWYKQVSVSFIFHSDNFSFDHQRRRLLVRYKYVSRCWADERLETWPDLKMTSCRRGKRDELLKWPLRIRGNAGSGVPLSPLSIIPTYANMNVLRTDDHPKYIRKSEQTVVSHQENNNFIWLVIC